MLSTHDVAVVVAVPLEGPTFRLSGTPGRNEAELVWEEIPQSRRQGFITHYTIYYTDGTKVHGMYLLHGVLALYVVVDCRNGFPNFCFAHLQM